VKRDADNPVARAALRRVWPDAATVEKAQIRALGGGVNPRTFLAVAGKQRYVLRLPHSQSVALLDLETEARAMRVAAAADLAPAVIAVDVEAGLLLTEYRAMPWTHELVRQPIAISVIVRLLRALHALPVDLPVYGVESIATRYLAALDSLQSPVSAEERVWADDLLRAARGFEARHAPTAFCHTDLVASNILMDGAAARLIDFEYAGRGAPLLDLASLAGLNGFTAEQRLQLLAEYYGKSVAEPMAREFDDAIRMLQLLAYFWARVATQRIPGTDVYSRLAAELGATLK
jgi:aminoglycoside phosphotransferase (APT) family kinase protein